MGWLDDARRVDVAVYAAIAATPTPALDRGMRRLSRAADYSRLSLAAAAVLLAVTGGSCRPAGGGDGAGLGGRRVHGHQRRDQASGRSGGVRTGGRGGRSLARHMPMPSSSSFPSGHSAAAFAFATGVGHTLPPRRRAVARDSPRWWRIPACTRGCTTPETWWRARFWAPRWRRPPAGDRAALHMRRAGVRAYSDRPERTIAQVLRCCEL